MSSQTAVIQALKQIADENGGIVTPAAVVMAAQPEDSPLHSRFEWDDEKASHNYRLWQARQLLRVCVELITVGDKQTTTNVFVSLTSDREAGGYRSLVHVMSDADKRQQLLADALRELELFQDKYRELQELSVIFSAIQQVKPTRQTRRRSRGLQPAMQT